MSSVSLLAARGLLIFAMAGCAFPQKALPADTFNPSLFQLQHTSWTERDGAPPDINFIAQAPDGSLWLGSGEGLYRFDGFTFDPVRAIDGDIPAPTEVYTLLATSDGSLWIGTAYSGAILLRNGVARRFPKFEGLPLHTTAWTFAEDLDGTIWMGTPSGLQRFDGTQWRSVGKAWGIPELAGFPVLRLDSNGTLWAEATGHRLFRLKRDLRHFEQLADFPQDSFPFDQSPSGEYWAATRSGICPLAEVLSSAAVSHCVTHYENSASRSIHGYHDLLFDRRGNLWMMSRHDGGIERLDAAAFRDAFRPGHPEGNIESFTKRDGLTSDGIRAIYRDRSDGSIWVGTLHGLDHFRESSFLPAFPKPEGEEFGVQAQKDGRVWIGSADKGGLWVASPQGKTEKITDPESIQSLYETGRGTLWFATYSPARVPSIASLRDDAKRTNLPLPPELQSQVAVQSIIEDRSGSVWASFLPYGLAKWDRGHWARNGGLAGLPEAWVVILNMSPDGKLWAGYIDGEAAVIDGTSVRRYTAKDLNIGLVAAIWSGQSNSWLAGPNGLVRFDGQRFHTLLEANNRPFSGITGIAVARNGDLWLNAWDGVRRVAAAELHAAELNSAYAVHSDLYDLTDGLPSVPQRVRPLPTAVSSPDGRIWFGLRAGVVSVDPQDPSLSSPIPPVSIVRAIADGQTYDITNAKLAARTKNLEIDYSAVSLNRASRVRFRYRLEPVDAGWREAGSRRQAFYNDLPPGKFRFVVSASNGDNVWNETGAIMNLEVPPAFNQTTWFRALCVAIFLVLLWALYRYRLYQIRHAYDARLEARVGERTRIARELHDTLLQSFQGLLLHLQVVSHLLPMRPEEGQQKLKSTINQTAEAIREGRDAVQDLRSFVTETTDLAMAFGSLGQQIAFDASNLSGSVPTFHVEVEGAPRALLPMVRDEVYRLAGEALRNAFRHAEAKHIELEIRYDEAQVRLRLRDDGKGIDPESLGGDGDEGHYGLRGMRERAKLLGGKFTIWSQLGSGTEVELIIPAAHAYTSSRRRRRFRLAEWLFSKDREEKT